MNVLETLGSALTQAAPEATDHDRWRRLMIVVVPLLILVLVLVGVAVWWLFADGGLQVLLHAFGGQPTGAGSVSTR